MVVKHIKDVFVKIVIVRFANVMNISEQRYKINSTKQVRKVRIKMNLYRIQTENKRRKFIEQLVSEHFAGFSIYTQTGYWHGKREKSLCIEIVSDSPAAALDINGMCKAICGYNKQECVLVQTIPVETKLIGVSGKVG